VNENPYQSPQLSPVPARQPDTRPWFMRPFHPATLAIALAAPTAIIVAIVVQAMFRW
jgi:hypothetical protein